MNDVACDKKQASQCALCEPRISLQIAPRSHQVVASFNTVPAIDASSAGREDILPAKVLGSRYVFPCECMGEPDYAEARCQVTGVNFPGILNGCVQSGL